MLRLGRAGPSPGLAFSPLIAQLTSSLKMEAFGAFIAPPPNSDEYIGKLTRERENTNSELKERFALEKHGRSQAEVVF